MNRSESKYFHTALRMDEALITLLEKKDLAYITVKEICQQANVNRSTFYLHYETIADLVNETVDMVNERFLSYFPQYKETFPQRIHECEPKDLIFITQEYLLPYLHFIQDNKTIYRAALRNPQGMQVHAQYSKLKKQILGPILQRFSVPSAHQPYYMAYYIEGIFAIIKEWLYQNCTEEVETIAAIIENCVRPKSKSDET